ncbi:MAG TPA: O-antigen ligase family protein [Pyrinomonadaceae bacterium]
MNSSTKQASTLTLGGRSELRAGPERLSALLERAVFYSLLALLVLVATPYGTTPPWRIMTEAVFMCGVFALGFLWMIEGMISGAWLSGGHRLLIPLLLLAVFIFAQTIPLGATMTGTGGVPVPAWQALSSDPYETQLAGWKLLAFILTLGLLLRYTSTPQRFRALLYLVIGIGVASALFGITRQAAQHQAPGFIFPYVRLDSGYAQFVNRNHFAFLMEMALGLVLGMMAGGGVRRERLLLYLAALVPLWSALVLSNSRGGIFSMLCQLILLALLSGTVRRRVDSQPGREFARLGRARSLASSLVVRIVLMTLLLTALSVGVIWIGGEQLVNRFETIPDEVVAGATASRAGVSRADVWRATLLMIKEHPLAGIGFGGYWAAVPLYHDASGRMTPRQAHNDYLEVAASGGIIGVLLLGWFVFDLLKRVRQRLASADPLRRAACFGALIGLFGIAVHSIVDFGLHLSLNMLVCLALVALATTGACVEEQPEGRRKGRVAVV